MVKKLTLNGQWDFIADLDPKYHDDTISYPIHPFSQPDADRRHWKKVNVPGVWQKYGERYDIFEGVCWFAREFYVDMAEFSNARARFGGVNYQCDVYINGQHAGSHEGGYTEFVLDTAKYLHRGENHIAVRADNRAATLKWPPCLGYFNYGGIHRDVVLELSDGPYLADITPKLAAALKPEFITELKSALSKFGGASAASGVVNKLAGGALGSLFGGDKK